MELIHKLPLAQFGSWRFELTYDALRAFRLGKFGPRQRFAAGNGYFTQAGVFRSQRCFALLVELVGRVVPPLAKP